MEVVVVVVVAVVAGIGTGTGEVLEAPEVCTLWGGVGASAVAASTWLFVWCLVSGVLSGVSETGEGESLFSPGVFMIILR